MNARQAQWETIGSTNNLVRAGSRGLIYDNYGNVSGLRAGWTQTRTGGTRYVGVS